jgi:hypothetical protein
MVNPKGQMGYIQLSSLSIRPRTTPDLPEPATPVKGQAGAIDILKEVHQKDQFAWRGMMSPPAPKGL